MIVAWSNVRKKSQLLRGACAMWTASSRSKVSRSNVRSGCSSQGALATTDCPDDHGPTALKFFPWELLEQAMRDLQKESTLRIYRPSQLVARRSGGYQLHVVRFGEVGDLGGGTRRRRF